MNAMALLSHFANRVTLWRFEFFLSLFASSGMYTSSWCGRLAKLSHTESSGVPSFENIWNSSSTSHEPVKSG